MIDDAMAARLVMEMNASREKWGPYRSTHEVYGVLCEEMKELLDAIHDNDDEGARHEAMQIAAVALRFSVEGWERNP
ncbi:MAG TPA: hypothetical protein VJP77_05690 [Planctomycetota bacterium]|nr:hypothetical protein [Planctomycetota bacterium]